MCHDLCLMLIKKSGKKTSFIMAEGAPLSIECEKEDCLVSVEM